MCFNSSLGILKRDLSHGRREWMEFQFLTRYSKTIFNSLVFFDAVLFQFLTRYSKTTPEASTIFIYISFNSSLGILKPRFWIYSIFVFLLFQFLTRYSKTGIQFSCTDNSVASFNSSLGILKLRKPRQVWSSATKVSIPH